MKARRLLRCLGLGAAMVELAGCGGGESAAPGSTAKEVPQAVAVMAGEGTSGWSDLASEGWRFTVNGTQTVRFGAGSSWVEKSVTGDGICSNSFFGRDPIYGTLKRCYLQESTNASTGAWLWVADEWQAIPNDGPRLLRFGTSAGWVEKSVAGADWCTNSAFGRDPVFGKLKHCFAWSADAGPDQPPTPSIDSPAVAATFRAGDALRYSGRAFDREDGWLEPASLVFSAELHHDTHTHPFLPATAGTGGTVAIPVRGETSPNIFYRFTLQATDATGQMTIATRDVLPQKSTMQFTTVPAGLALSLDGQPLTTPLSVTGVVGMERDLGAADQIANGRRYRFVRWNDGGAPQHTLSTPVADTTYTATFSDLGSAANQAPSIALSATPTATNGTPTTLTANAADSDGSVTKVSFFDGTLLIGERVATPFTLSWTPLTNGAHALSARATDNDGASATSAVVTVSVSAATPRDTQPPQAALSSPGAFAAGLLGTIQLTATASDNVGVSRVEFQIDGTPIGNVTATAADAYRLDFDSNAYASGQHVLRVRAADAAGNLSAWSSATVAFGGGRNQPSGFNRDEQWLRGLDGATSMAQTPEGRWLVTEQGGSLRVIKGGTLLAEPMLQVSTAAVGERGLLGVALHPDFRANGFVYVYYTSTEGGAHNRISRFVASGDKSTGVETVLVDLPTLSSATNHNGGALHFGADGKLYVGVGENALPSNSQDLTTPLGKLLRFNDDGSIPPDNPFYGRQTGLARAVWAYGLRNPFTFAVDPASGRIHINDVGQSTWEEINLGAPGANYGWPGSEGPDNLAGGISGPLFTYRHDAASPAGSGPGGFFIGACIVGGAFYPSSGSFPATYGGSYFFTDYLSGLIGRVDLANGNAAYAFATVSQNPVDLMVGQDGALYVLDRLGITRISAAP